MASSEIIYKFRQVIGDLPIQAFNKATADGVNASWVVSNTPMQPASEYIYLDGSSQNEDDPITSISEDTVLGAFSIIVDDPANIEVGDEIFIGDSPEPVRYKVNAVDPEENEISFNRPIEEIFVTGAVVSKGEKVDYSVVYRTGVVFFDTPPTANVRMNATYSYFKNRDDILNAILENASNEVEIEIGEAVDIENDTSHRALVFAKAHLQIISKDLSVGAASSIKVKQGSTSLDLTGASAALREQMKAQTRRYDDLLSRYLMGELNKELPYAVVGPEDYQVNG